MMGAWTYCTNEDCQRGFDRPSFAEITARKRECPACGQINHVGDDLGKALDEKFAQLVTAGSQLVAVGTIVPPPTPLVLGEANAENLDSAIAALRDALGTNTGRFSATSANASNRPKSAAAGQKANTAPQLVGTLTYSVSGTAKLRLADGVALPPGHYTISLTKES